MTSSGDPLTTLLIATIVLLGLGLLMWTFGRRR
jgi:hypothetical protein